MRPLLWLLIASLLSFGVWYVLRPDPRAGEGTSAEVLASPAAQESMPASEEPLPAIETLGANAAEIVSMFEGAPWVHRGLNGPTLYVVSFRSCPTCLAFKEAELAGLESAGVDVRWIVYARRDREGRERSSSAERAVQAELWLTRDWHLFEDWYAVDPATYYATADLPPAADDDPERTSAVEEARAFVDRLSALYTDEGIDLYIPTLLWQEADEWKTYVGYEETSFAPVREALTGE